MKNIDRLFFLKIKLDFKAGNIAFKEKRCLPVPKKL